jgi:hypothetical protein
MVEVDKKTTGGGDATALGLLEALIFSDLDGICPWKKIVRPLKGCQGSSSSPRLTEAQARKPKLETLGMMGKHHGTWRFLNPWGYLKIIQTSWMTILVNLW